MRVGPVLEVRDRVSVSCVCSGWNFLWGNLWLSAPEDPSASVPCVPAPPVFSNREGSAVAGTGGGFEDLQIQISQEVGRRCN